MIRTKYTGRVLDVARQRGGAEPHATVLHDHSRFSNDGAFLGAGEPAWVQLPSGLWTLDFDGLNDHIEVPDHPSLDIAGDGSLEFWFKAISWRAGAMIEKGETNASANMNYAVWGGIDARPVFYIGDGVGSNSVTVVGALSIDIWYHLLVTWDGTNLRLYLDGVENNSAGQTRTPLPNTDRLLLGWSSALYSNISIALVRIYTYVLSAGQILQSFEATRSLFGV